MWQAEPSLVRVGDERGQGLDHSYQHATQHGAHQVADSSLHRRRKSKEAKRKTEIEN